MTIHIGAKPGDYAELALLPGDPLRAKYIAEKFLSQVQQVNTVRGMLGFTGIYQGRRVSVQGSGMGVPSFSIYAHELINDFGVKTLIRVGSCGAYQPQVQIRDLILAQSASTDSSAINNRFPRGSFAPTASFSLLQEAYIKAKAKEIPMHVGNVFSTDTFYSDDDPEEWRHWAKYGVLAVDMETAGLYTLGARYNVRTLSIMTVSDHLGTGAAMSSIDREVSLNAMVELALSLSC